jgi:hypothetical protein
MSNDRQHAKDLLQTKQRRLWKLEEQAVHYGPDCPPHIALEIEDLRREIDGLEASVKAAAPPLTRTDRLIALSLTLIALTVYLRTLSPSLSFLSIDSTELATLPAILN